MHHNLFRSFNVSDTADEEVKAFLARKDVYPRSISAVYRDTGSAVILTVVIGYTQELSPFTHTVSTIDIGPDNLFDNPEAVDAAMEVNLQDEKIICQDVGIVGHRIIVTFLTAK